jgi:hypothetical protein
MFIENDAAATFILGLLADARHIRVPPGRRLRHAYAPVQHKGYIIGFWKSIEMF